MTESLDITQDVEQDGEETHCYTVDKYMLPAKFAYFFCNARYAVSDYYMLFYTSTGLSPSQAGLVNGIQYIGGLIANPLWGFLADKRGRHRYIVLFLCAMAVIAVCIQPFLSATYSPASSVCPITVPKTADVKEKTTLFYSLLIAAIFTSSFDSTIMNFVDVGVLRRVKMSPRRSEFGMQRYAASIGTSLASIAYSFSLNYFPPGPVSCYGGIFITYVVFTIGLCVTSSWLFHGLSFPREERVSENLSAVVLNHLRKFDTLFFLLSVFLNGAVQALYFSFFFLYLKKLGAPTLLLGFSVSINSVSAVTVYILSERFVNFLRGSRNAMCLSCFVWAVRFMCLAYLVNPYAVFALDIFHGFTFSLYKVASFQYVKETTDEKIFTTMCGIVNALYLCFSFFITNVIGGKLYEEFGPKKLFIGTSVLCLIWTAICGIDIVVKEVLKRGKYERIRDSGFAIQNPRYVIS